MPYAVPPKVPVIAPNKVPQPLPYAVPPKITQKTPTLISQVPATGSKHSKVTIHNTHKQVAINYNANYQHSVVISNNNTPKSIIVPHTVSLQIVKLHYKGPETIDALNVNKHLVSHLPGDNVEQNHHAILVDHNDKAWRCKVSGLGHRSIGGNGPNEFNAGHMETMHFRNATFSHISNNIAINNDCLISVSK